MPNCVKNNSFRTFALDRLGVSQCQGAKEMPNVILAFLEFRCFLEVSKIFIEESCQVQVHWLAQGWSKHFYLLLWSITKERRQCRRLNRVRVLLIEIAGFIWTYSPYSNQRISLFESSFFLFCQ